MSTPETSVQFALYAFRKREKSFVLIAAASVYILLSLLLSGAFYALAWSDFAPLLSWYVETVETASHSGEPTMPPREAVLAVLPWYGAMALIGLVLYGAFEAACLRWMVRGERGGLAGLSLGGDTWLMVLTYLVWIVLALVFTCVVGGFYYGLYLFNSAVPGLQLLSMLIGALAPLGFAALLIWVAVRLSPAGAASIRARKFAFFSAWGATRGRFWPLLGAFVILIAVYLAVSFALSALLRAQMVQWLQPAIEQAMRGAEFDVVLSAAMAGFATPASIALLAAYVLSSVILSMIFYVAWFGVNAGAVAQDSKETPAAAAPAPPEPAAPVQAPTPPAPAPAAVAPVPVVEAPAPEPAPVVAEAPPPEPVVTDAPPAEAPIVEAAAEGPPVESAPAEASAPEPAAETPAEPTPASEPEKPAS